MDIVFGADFEAVEAAAEEAFAAIRAAAAQPLAIGPANVEEFQTSALEAVAAVRAELVAAMAPAELPPVYATATRLDQFGAEGGPLALPPGESGGYGEVVPYGGGPYGGTSGGAYGGMAGGMSGGTSGTPYGPMGAPTGGAPPFGGYGPTSFQPGYTPGPLFGGGQDPYAAVYQQFQQQFAQQPLVVPIRAANPIDDAWLAQVKSSIKSIAGDALDLPVNADLEPFQATLESTLAELASTSRADIPIDVGDAMIFRQQVAELVQQVESSVHAVIDVQISDEGALTELQTKTVAASQATLDLVNAEQKLNEAMASGDQGQIAKARAEVVSATKAEADASKELETAMAAAAEEEVVAGDAAKGAAFSMRTLNEAMGPLWMVMNVAQIAMMGFYSSSNQTSNSTKDLSQQIIDLGKNTSNATASLAGNTDLSKLNNELLQIGQSSAQFSQAFSGSVQQATGYVNSLTQAQQELGAQSVKVSDQVLAVAKSDSASAQDAAAAAANKTTADAIEQIGNNVKNTTMSIKDLTQAVNDHKISEAELPPAVQHNIDVYNAYNDIIAQAKKALADEQATQALVVADLRQQGIVLSSAQQGWNSIGQAVENTVSEFNKATTGVKALADATVGAAAANAQAQAQFIQLDAAVVQAHQGVVTAEHGVQTAREGVASATLGLENAQYAVTMAEQGYQNALRQEAQAQQQVADARKQAQQNLIDLQLQANDAAASSLNANVQLFDAQQAAAKLGVNASNMNAVASEQVTAQNEAQVKAAIALIEAMNQVADAHNTASQAQGNLSTAQQLGIDGNAGVVSANQALASSAQQVAAAQHGVTTAQDGVNQASIALANATFAVQQAQEASRQAADAYRAAQDNASRSTDITTSSGNRNWQMLEQLFEKNFTATGSIQQATDWTEKEGEKMGFTAGQIDGVINSVTRIPLVTDFSIVGTPSLNLSTLLQQAQAQGISPYSLGLPAGQVDLARGPMGSSYAQGGAIGGAGGPTADDQLIWASTGEHMWTADEVQAAGGHGAVEALRRSVKGYATGGAITPQEAMGINLRLAGWDAVLQGASYGLQGLGAGTPNLPKTDGKVDFGGFGAAAGGLAPPAGSVGGSRGANEAIMRNVFASMFGWAGPEWDAAYQLEMMEAGFNNLAQNPHSTAFGMGQFLDGTWASYGIAKTADPTLQSIAMGRYIASRYHDPIGALAHEHAFHWYANGGPTSNGISVIGDAGAEAVRLPNGSTVMPAANTAGLVGVPAQTDIKMTFGGSVHNGFATLIMNMVRAGQIVLTVNGQRVKAGG